jgi:hypothetical protein
VNNHTVIIPEMHKELIKGNVKLKPQYATSLMKMSDTKEKATGTSNSFHRCPFCSCCFLTKHDLERHVAFFGTSKDEHSERYRKVHIRTEHGVESEQE